LTVLGVKFKSAGNNQKFTFGELLVNAKLIALTHPFELPAVEQTGTLFKQI
jgi:hypothetical protein